MERTHFKLTSKIKSFLNNHSLLDFIRKIINVMIRLFLWKILSRLRGFYYFKSFTVLVPRSVTISGQIFKISTGENLHLSANCALEFSQDSILDIGTNVYLAHSVLISCRNKIKIGTDTQIGEFTSIRDSTHDYSEKGVPMKYNPDLNGEIIIGSNVWIGRGCLILPNTTIEDGVVVGANSVVKGLLVRDSIYAGSPVKFIKKRC